ncbi:unnamed protein product [Eruca vesicaria subsp. sativa]|uniref:PPPDE domain-containing protein n=1 Tax=Eruca vesicaria subsp. sativa TaxID=29727 RepID=A0ABC8KIK9_ERUVS|nr:unnamed protein product [Eruca vesicaria subsp. sativa]
MELQWILFWFKLCRTLTIVSRMHMRIFWLWVNEILVKFNDGGVVSVRGGGERQKVLGFAEGEVKREAIVYGDEEWSYGFCEQGTGVFSCPSSKNPMYTYREKIVLGRTACSTYMVNQILRELSKEWPGQSYDLLSKNCNHFCDVLCEVLGVPKLLGWVNRFAHAGDTALEVAGAEVEQFES